MATVDLTQVKKVVVASDAKGTSDLLEKGWRLIDTASGVDESGYPITKYSLGWFEDTDPRQ